MICGKGLRFENQRSREKQREHVSGRIKIIKFEDQSNLSHPNKMPKTNDDKQNHATAIKEGQYETSIDCWSEPSKKPRYWR